MFRDFLLVEFQVGIGVINQIRFWPAFLKDRVARCRQMALPARRAKDSRGSGMPTYRESANSSGTQQECHWASRSSESLRNAG
ncbi:MAG: hypothetical protein DVB23_000404 [Verrucomicrobia bacterium]|nr:MAG: hypothetical protein DVB23_000404 [Verrucomicrobiota bacterium]